jgi:diguanylate cyclase (GGDEF)-like protein
MNRASGRSAPTSYALALLALIGAVLLRYLLDPWLGAVAPLVTIYGAVAVAVWLGGYRPAIAVAILGYLTCNYLFIEPRGQFGFSRFADLVSVLPYVVTSAPIIGLGESTRRAHLRAAEQQVEAQSAKEALAERVEELNRLNRMGGQLQACLSLDEAYRVVGTMGGQLFPRESGVVFSFDGSRKVIEAVATWGSPSAADLVFAPDQCWSLRNGQSYVVPDTRAGVLCGHLPAPPPAAYHCAPLVAQGDAIGLLYVGSSGGHAIGPTGEQRDAHRRLIEGVAAQLALGLANVRLRDVLRSESIRDPLTGLFNRRYMDETLEREVRRAHRAVRPLVVLILDLDGFKQLNDTFGHEAGDAFLRELGLVLTRALRREDVVCRYGGDEVVAVLPEASREAGRRRAEEIREAVKGIRITHRGQPLAPLTVSIGLAAMPEDGFDGHTLLAAADAALYRAKREGRDRVALAA